MASRAPLLPKPNAAVAGARGRELRQGTPVSSALNLAAAAVGSGILTLPFGFACAGIFWGTLILLVLGGFAGTTLVFLVQVGRASKLYSFEHNAEQLFGAVGGRCFNLLFTLLLLMVYVAYARTAVDLLPTFLRDQFGTRWFFGEVPVGVFCTAAMYLVVVLSKSLHALRYTSALALCCLLYFVLLLLARGFTAMSAGTSESSPSGFDAQYEPGSIWLAPPLFMSSLLCHFNMFDVEQEMRPEYYGSVVPTCYVVMFSIAALYILVGVVGYSLFGDRVSDDVLKDFGADTAVQLARFLLGLTNAFRIPLIVGPLHRSVRHMFGFPPPLSSALDAKDVSDKRRRAHALEVAAIMFGGLGVAVSMPLGKVLGLIGCTCGTLTCVSFPAAMYLRCFGSRSAIRSASAVVVLLFSFFIVVTGVVANIR